MWTIAIGVVLGVILLYALRLLWPLLLAAAIGGALWAVLGSGPALVVMVAVALTVWQGR